MPLYDCPRANQLRAFALGHISEADAEPIAAHLDRCPNCAETVDRMSLGTDPILAQARHLVVEEQEADRQCHHVVERIKQLANEPSFKSGAEMPTLGSGSLSGREVEVSARPQQLRDYQLLEKLGEGGMGAVYKARHEHLDKLVAIKVLPADRLKDAAAVARFQREMRAVGKLEHPNIVRAMDAGEVDGTHFLVMEYVEGIDLSQLVKQRGPLPIADACELIRQAAVGLDEAHENGMVHRDIKPSNIMLCMAGKRKPPVVKVLDMGLALLSDAHSAGTRELTSTGQMMGTLDYMAPEQGGDSKKVDIRADIYALGASLYRLLTGQVIYHGEQYQTPVQKMMALALEPAPAIQSRREDVPTELAAIVHRMLEKTPEKRYATPQEVADALSPLCAGADLAALLQGNPAASTFADQSLTGTESDVRSGDLATDHGRSHAPQEEIDDARPLCVDDRATWTKRIVIVAVGGVAVLLAGIILLWRTPDGTVQFEIQGDDIKLVMDNKELAQITGASAKPITVKPGKHKLQLSIGDDLNFETTDFEIKKGQDTKLKITWLPGDMLQVSQDKQHLHQGRKRPIAAEAIADKPTTRLPSTALGSPFDRLRREDISPYELTAAGYGDASQAPTELVAIFGDSRMRHNGPPFGITVSADGKWIASGTYDWTVRVWDAATGREHHSFPGAYAQFAPNNQRLALPHQDGADVYDVSTGKILQQFPARRPAIRVAYNGNGSRLAVLEASKDEEPVVSVWDVAKEKKLNTISIRQLQAERLALNCDGTRLATGGHSGSVKVWNTQNGEAVTELKGYAGQITSLAFHPDGSLLAVASTENSLDMWDTQTWQPAESFKGWDSKAQYVAFSADGSRMAVLQANGWVRDINPKNGEELGILTRKPASYDLPSGTGFVNGLACFPDGTRVVTGGNDGAVRVWDRETGKELPLGSSLGAIWALAVHPDGRQVAVGTQHGIAVWGVPSGRIERHLTDHNGSFSALRWSPDGKYLASGSDFKLGLCVWSASTWERLLLRPTGNVTDLAFSPDSSQLVVVGDENAPVSVIDLATWKEAKRYEIRDSASAAFSPDGKRLALGLRSNRVLMLDPENGEVLWSAPAKETVHALRFSSDGRELTGRHRESKTTQTWDAANGRETWAQSRQKEFAASPDGRWGFNGRIFNCRTGEPLRTFSVPSLLFPNDFPAAFTPDGRHVVSAAPNGVILIHRLNLPPETTSPPQATGGIVGTPRQQFSPNFALQFAAGNHVELPLPADPGERNPVTFEALVRISEAPPDEGQGIIISWPAMGSLLRGQHSGSLGIEPAWKFRIPNGRNTSNIAVFEPSADWTHLAGVADKNEIRLFVDGKQQPLRESRYQWQATDVDDRRAFLGAIALASGAFRYGLHGIIDEVRISNIARYDRDFTPPKLGDILDRDEHTIALYHFDEGTGDVLKDSSGNNHHGKIVGAKWVRSDLLGADKDVLAWLKSRLTHGENLFIVQVKGGRRELKPGDPLPAKPYSLIGVRLNFWQDIGSEELTRLQELPVLREFDVCRLPEERLPLLNPNLEHLTLHALQANGSHLKDLRRLHKLRYLSFQNTSMDDADLQHLKELPQLEYLALGGTQITDDGLAHLSPIKTLQSIELPAGIAGPGLKHLESMAIKRLNVSPQQELSDRLLEGVNRIQSLEILAVPGTGLSDEQLLKLTALKNLRHLNVEQTYVTAAGVAAFNKLLPQCDVYRPALPGSDAANRAVGLKFDGVDDYVSIPVRRNALEPYTIETWIDARPGGDFGVPIRVNGQGMMQLFLNRDGTVIGHYAYRDQNGNDFEEPNLLVKANPFGHRIHLALVCEKVNAGAEMRLYLDGKCRSRKTIERGQPHGEYQGDSMLGAACKETAEPTAFFAGHLYETRISNVARYNEDFTPKPRFEPDDVTIALYHFNEGEGNVLTDSSGNGHHGKIVGAKWVKAAPQTIVVPAVSPPANGPFDQLKREDIPPHELAVAGNGDAANATKDLVAVVGDSKLRSWIPIFHVRYSPDGSQLLSVTQEQRSIEVRDAATGQFLKSVPFNWPGDGFAFAGFSADGSRLAISRQNNEVLIRDALSGKTLFTCDNSKCLVHAVAFSADGKWLAQACDDKSIRICDATTGKEVRALSGHSLKVGVVAFSRDGKLLVSSTHRKGEDLRLPSEVKLWNVADGKELHSLEAPTSAAYDLAFSPDGNLLACPTNQRVGSVWDTNSGRKVSSWKVPADVTAMAWSADSGRVFLGHVYSSQLFVMSPLTGEVVDTIPAPYGIWNLAISPDGNHLAAASYSQEIWVWDSATLKPILTPLESISCVASSPDGRWLALGGNSKEVKLWDVAARKVVRTLSHSDAWVAGLAFSPDGQRLVGIGSGPVAGSSVHAWNVADGQTVSSWRAGDHGAGRVAYSRDGSRLATVCPGDVFAKVYDAQTLEGVCTYRSTRGPLSGVAFSPDGQYVASACSDKSVVVLWDAATGKELHVFPSPPQWQRPTEVLFNPNGKQLLAEFQNNTVAWDMESKQELWQMQGWMARAVSADGNRLIVATNYPGVLRLLDGRTLDERRRWELPGEVTSASFTPDGRHVLTRNANGTVYVLRVAELKNQ